MSDPDGIIRWAPRVPREKIRRLYESEAKGILDEELIEDVGLMLYLRCKSILTIEEAKRGRVHCPACDTIFQRQERRDEHEQLLCPSCGWAMNWKDFARTFKRKQFNTGGAGDAFRLYMRQYERTETARQRLLLIDRLIHAFHVYLFEWTQQPQPTRPACPNLIEGKMHDLIPFLDSLSYGEGSLPERREIHDAWRQALRDMEQFYQRFCSLPREVRRKVHEGD